VSGRDGVRRAAPWVICAVSLALTGLAPALWWLLRDQPASGQVDWVDATINAIGFVGIPVVGALIAARLPENPYGWVWCAAGLAFAFSNVVRPLVRLIGGPIWVTWVLESWGFVSLIGFLAFVFLLFPDGHVPTQRWRWLARALVAGMLVLALAVVLTPNPDNPAEASPWAMEGALGRQLSQAIIAGVYVMFGLVMASMVALVLRFRRAGPVERRQLTWFVYATVLNGVLLVLDVLGIGPSGRIDTVVYSLGFVLLPAAVAIAMLRYRLYDIDRIVSRTVSYGLLTAGLIGLYLLVVALLRTLLEPLTGSSALAVAGSTLAVAAAFNPARTRLQAVVDRRFDRARYDAVRAVDRFAARLRDQVDLDQITTGLCDTVNATVAPGRVAVWLRSPGRPRGPEQ
jgi:N-terminal 7TM region of histidine kinase